MVARDMACPPKRTVQEVPCAAFAALACRGFGHANETLAGSRVSTSVVDVDAGINILQVRETQAAFSGLMPMSCSCCCILIFHLDFMCCCMAC